MHAFTLVLVGLQSAAGAADNGCQFSRRRRGALAAVELRMPVCFFLLLPIASISSANHHQDQTDPDRHQLKAAKVRILMLMTNTKSKSRRFGDLYIPARWRGWDG